MLPGEELCFADRMSDPDRYDKPANWFRRCGRSGLKLPAVSLGFWQNFGDPGTASHGIEDPLAFHERARSLIFTAFDQGITHFDFANNYGPPAGAAEARCGRILRDLPREELVISSKAGFVMWPGPYGNWGSRKYLIESCDQSLDRLQLDHVDIFYHHRPDPETPLEETLGALDTIVRTGRAHYCGISNYPGALAEEAMAVCEQQNFIRPIIHQPKYNLFHRTIESDLLPVIEQRQLGVICFSPLAQGLLTNKYLEGIPSDSRAGSSSPFLREEQVDASMVEQVRGLNQIAQARGQSLAQMAITWILRWPTVSSALIGASRPGQITELVQAAEAPPLSQEELDAIDRILGGN